jgi:hypothetical protein
LRGFPEVIDTIGGSPSATDAKALGQSGAYFRVLNYASPKGLLLLVFLAGV